MWGAWAAGGLPAPPPRQVHLAHSQQPVPATLSLAP